MQKWSLYIDVEGFKKIYSRNDSKAIYLLRLLIQRLYWVGCNLFSDENEQLFVYQFGDGFVITPDFETDTRRPVCLAIALMRLLLLNEGIAKAAIASGSMADILSCFPEEIVENPKRCGHSVPMGEGILLFCEVMGEGLLNSYARSEKVSGPMIILSEEAESRLDKDGIVTECINGHTCINWIHSDNELIESIQKISKIPSLGARDIARRLDNYIKSNDLPEEWVNNARKLIHPIGT